IRFRGRARHDLAVYLNSEIALVPIESNGGAVEKLLVDIFLPQVTRLHHVHIRIHRFVTIFHGVLLLKQSLTRITKGGFGVNLGVLEGPKRRIWKKIPRFARNDSVMRSANRGS